MRKLTYLAIFETDEQPGISIFFPDVPGCISCGDNFDHALKMAQEALGLHIYGLEKAGESPPERHDALPELDKGDLVVPVSIYPDLFKEEIENRRVKITVTLPYWIKSIAEKEGVNFSRLLESALKERLNTGID
ncbi:antitoxin HicB [Spirochaetia bacterium]|nr:antitoxin HicB [Spirochaetia bacterium]GHU33872.1 antitoxin HicB [Spirochaetia bacterium]